MRPGCPGCLCFFLAVGWAGFGIKWYRGTSAKSNETGSEAAGGVAGKSGAGSATRPGELDSVTLEVKGYLIPTQQISISPIDVAGRVVKLNIEEGMSFQKGDILAEIDSTPYQAQLAEAKAQVAASKARWAETDTGSRPEEKAQALAELDDAKAQLEQFRREWARFEGQKSLAITTREYEQAEAGYLSAKKRVEARAKGLRPRDARPTAGAKRRRPSPNWKRCRLASGKPNGDSKTARFARQ